MNELNNLKARVEGLGIDIESAVDMLQLIEEDLNSNFFHESVERQYRVRAGITVSAIRVLSDYLTGLSKEASTLANGTPEA